MLVCLLFTCSDEIQHSRVIMCSCATFHRPGFHYQWLIINYIYISKNLLLRLWYGDDDKMNVS